MARLARHGGTLATFTPLASFAAGCRRPALACKTQRLGRKREMLIGELTADVPTFARTPWFARSGSQSREAAVIGGGIASALLSLALLRRGWQVICTALTMRLPAAHPAIVRARCIRY